MTATMTLTIDPDGTGHCLYDELIDLHALGTLECQRASHIEFDSETQRWQVLTPDRKTVLFSAVHRTHCLAWEKTHFRS
jgi:hypothetical protein